MALVPEHVIYMHEVDKFLEESIQQRLVGYTKFPNTIFELSRNLYEGAWEPNVMVKQG